MSFKPGDEIVTKTNLFWMGEDIGDRLGKVIDTKGHILIKLYDYDSNPVKCFRYEIELLKLEPVDIDEFNLEEMFGEEEP